MGVQTFVLNYERQTKNYSYFSPCGLTLCQTNICFSFNKKQFICYSFNSTFTYLLFIALYRFVVLYMYHVCLTITQYQLRGECRSVLSPYFIHLQLFFLHLSECSTNFIQQENLYSIYIS